MQPENTWTGRAGVSVLIGDIVDAPIAGVFDSFGLSKTATVP